MALDTRRKQFSFPSDDQRPIYYFEFPSVDTARSDIEALIGQAVQTCRQCGCGALIPQLPFGTELNGESLATVRMMYATVLEQAEQYDLRTGFYLDPAFEHAIIHAMGEIGEHGLRAQLLHCKEHACSRGERIQRKLTSGNRLSLVAFSEETCEIIDLRPFVTDGRLDWRAPTGNYVIREYLSVPDEERQGANYLSYDASLGYIRAVFALFADVFKPYLGKTLTILSYSGIGFNGRNRRSWDANFNRAFEARFGFDPSPYYPALFNYIGTETKHIKAYFMTVRASLLQNGILRALRDFADETGLTPFGNLSEPKLTACSFSMGDAMLNNSCAPCALFDKAYMYGTNSVKIAAGAAYNFDIDRVDGELFRNYTRHDKARLYKDAMNAFARGVNHTALHLTDELTQSSDFCDFVTRVQSTLRGGRHVADIAMLYPIYHLHSQTGLYTSPATGYEYPETPSTADYMTLINSISIYAGHDLTLLHPEVLNTRCHTEGGVLYLDNKHNRESFRVVVMPSSDIISVQSLRTLKKFYDEGGKILATGVLPALAFEHDENGENDREVRRLVEEIFGHDACDPRIMRDYCRNTNKNGGDALFLYFNASAADGTRMTRSSTVNRALNSFDIPFDIYLPGMPRLECTGGLNSNFPEFRTIGLDRAIPGGGMLNHIHKQHDNCDIYYLTNTTSETYDHYVLLRGAFTVEEWNPHTGEICTEKKCGLLSYKGEIYTKLHLTLASCTSIFLCAHTVDATATDVEVIHSIAHLESEHAELMSEF